MAEWSNASVLKTEDQKWSGGSNPSSSDTSDGHAPQVPC